MERRSKKLYRKEVESSNYQEMKEKRSTRAILFLRFVASSKEAHFVKIDHLPVNLLPRIKVGVTMNTVEVRSLQKVFVDCVAKRPATRQWCEEVEIVTHVEACGC